MTGSGVLGNSLQDPAVARQLDLLHRAARGDWRHGVGVLPYFVFSKLTGRSFMRLVSPSMLKHMYLPVSRQQGHLLYALTRATHATRVVEFGASFGISTLYLAAAVRDNGGGQVITTEIELVVPAVAVTRPEVSAWSTRRGGSGRRP